MIPLKDDIPTRRFPILTVALIAINVAVFFGFQDARLSLSGAQVDQQRTVEYGLIPYELTNPGKRCGIVRDRVQTVHGLATRERVACEGQPGVAGEAPAPIPVWMTLFTAMFMHGGILHLAGNMLFLWIFGNNVEDRLGRVKFIVFYLLTGVIASLAHVAANPDSIFPTVGASGAIAGVLGAYLVMFPRARVTSVVPIPVFFLFMLRVQLPAVVVLGLWFLSQFFIGSAQQLGGAGVAWMAHVGGFLAGMALILPFGGRRRAPQGWEW